MYLTHAVGSHPLNLNQKCGCDGEDYNVINIVGDNFVLSKNNNSKIGLKTDEFFIDVSNTLETSLTIEANTGKKVLFTSFVSPDEYKFIGISVNYTNISESKKLALWRPLSPYRNDSISLRFHLISTFRSTNITGDSFNITFNFTLTPDLTSVILTWDNFLDYIFDEESYENWVDLNGESLTWYGVSPQSLTTNLLTPTFSGEITGVFSHDENGDYEGIIEGELPNSINVSSLGTYIYFKLTGNTLTGDIQFEDVEFWLFNKIFGRIYGEIIGSVSVISEELVGETIGDFATISAKYYHPIQKLLILTANDGNLLDPIEVYNNSDEPLVINCFIGI